MQQKTQTNSTTSSGMFQQFLAVFLEGLVYQFLKIITNIENV